MMQKKENQNNEIKHISVLLREVLDNLITDKKGIYIDCTLGLGGHSEAILNSLNKQGKVIGFEKDERNLEIAKERLKEFGDRMIFINNGFENLKEELEKLNIKEISGILFDLGLSSPQLESSGRGFSFLKDEPLDMRFDLNQTLTAYQVINRYSDKKLIQIFKEYGEEWKAKSIVIQIIKERRGGRLQTTKQLAEIIERVYESERGKERGKGRGKEFIPSGKICSWKINPATKVFQALRIFVNDELNALHQALNQGIEVLKPGGRIAAISYHSLEDRIVKRTFKREAVDCICPPEILICECGHKKTLKILTKKPITPSAEEINQNKRARSAKMRIAEKLQITN